MLQVVFSTPGERARIRELNSQMQALTCHIERIEETPLYALFSYYVGGLIHALTQGYCYGSNLYTLIQKQEKVITDLTSLQIQQENIVRRRSVVAAVGLGVLIGIGYGYRHKFLPQQEDTSSSKGVVWARSQEAIQDLLSRKGTLRDVLTVIFSPLERIFLSSSWQALTREEKAERLLKEFAAWQEQFFCALSPKNMLSQLQQLTGNREGYLSCCQNLEKTFDSTQCAGDSCKQAKTLVPKICPTTEAAGKLLHPPWIQFVLDRLKGEIEEGYGSYFQLPKGSSGAPQRVQELLKTDLLPHELVSQASVWKESYVQNGRLQEQVVDAKQSAERVFKVLMRMFRAEESKTPWEMGLQCQFAMNAVGSAEQSAVHKVCKQAVGHLLPTA